MRTSREHLAITNTHAGTTLVETGAGPDTVNVRATTGPGQTTVDAESGDDTVNVSSDAPSNSGILDAIDGQLNVNTGSGIDTLNVSDFGDNAGDTYDLTLVGAVTELDFNDGFAGVEIRYDANGTAGQLEHFNLVGANDLAANNVYNINDTTATLSNTISDGDATITGAGNDGTFNIQADAVQAGAANTFNGFDGNDAFNVNFRADLSIPVALGTTFVINGGQRVADTDNRDLVRIKTALDASTGRVLGITYASAADGDVDITGLGTPAFMDVNTVETLFYTGNDYDDDAVTVTGTTADDDLTVAPLSLASALVFRGGNPWDGPADAETFDEALPGIAEADGSTGPDMLLDGLAATLFTVDGGGAGADGNQLYVYGTSENDLIDPVTQASGDDLFGFGGGVVIPGAGRLGLNHAFDEILVTDALVRLVDDVDAVVPADARIRVNIVTPSFVQANPLDMGLFVNSGFEASPASSTPVDDIADDIRAALSYNFAMRINGGNPLPAFAPDGDRLRFTTPGEVNIHSDKSVPPIVTVTSTDPSTATTSYGLGFSSIENMVLTPGPTSQTVNIIGDNNDPAIDQNDNYVINGTDVDALLPALAGLPPILGVAFNPTASPIHPDFEPDPDGDNEFFLEINGSSLIGFRNVAQVNGFGDDRNPAPGTPSVGPDDIDRMEITPYANDTPTGWGIDVAFDEGNPDLDGAAMPDLVVYNGVAGVSEEIIISPSGPGSGQLIVNNAATGTPIVVIDYTTNTGIRINGNDGSAGDTDVLTLRGTDGTTPGTSGNETVRANFAAAGTAADPVVSVSDTALGSVLYELIGFSNFDTINFDLDDGHDTITILGSTNDGENDGGFGMDNVNVFAGSGDDMLIVDNSSGLSDFAGGLFYDGAAGNHAHGQRHQRR